MVDFFGLPEQDAELGLAVRILSSRANTQYAVLDALVGEPLRYAALRDGLRIKNDTTLNRALRALRGDGLIDQRADLEAGTMQYRLTALGKLVWARIQQMHPHQDSIDAYARGKTVLA